MSTPIVALSSHEQTAVTGGQGSGSGVASQLFTVPPTHLEPVTVGAESQVIGATLETENFLAGLDLPDLDFGVDCGAKAPSRAQN